VLFDFVKFGTDSDHMTCDLLQRFKVNVIAQGYSVKPSFHRQIIALSSEIRVAKSNGDVRISMRSCEIAIQIIKYKCKKQSLSKTVIGDIVAHLKPQKKFTVLL